MKSATIAENLFEAHESLMQAVHRLEKEIAQLSAPAWSRTLPVVREQIRTHFNMEEEGGYMQQVLQQRPFLEREVEKLLQEHRRLDSTLEGIIADLNPTADLAKLAERIHAWIHQLRQHEREENLLVEDAFGTDIGTKD